MFAGSFAPFTFGHLDILERGLGLFDEVIVAVGYNADKSAVSDEDVVKRVKHIEGVVGNHPRVNVVAYSGLTVDAAREHGVTALLRGVRSVADFEYECKLADVNRRISGLDTVILISDARWASVSCRNLCPETGR